MAVAAYTLRLAPLPQNGTPLLPRPRPYLRRRVVAKAATSWAPAGSDQDDGVGGWSLPEPPVGRARRTGIGKAIAVGLGASVAIGLAGLAWHYPSSRKCLQQLMDSRLHYFQEKISTLNLKPQEKGKEDSFVGESDENEAAGTVLDANTEAVTDESRQNHGSNGGTHVLFSVSVDPAHEEAFSILKKLQARNSAGSGVGEASPSHRGGVGEEGGWLCRRGGSGVDDQRCRRVRLEEDEGRRHRLRGEDDVRQRDEEAREVRMEAGRVDEAVRSNLLRALTTWIGLWRQLGIYDWPDN